jgi:hypothetical protein
MPTNDNRKSGEEEDLQRIANPNPPREREDEGKGDEEPDLGELDTETGDVAEGDERAATSQQGSTHPDDPHSGKGQEPLQPNLERDDERE